jgi:uncharacterized protein with HEPN domain
MSEARRDIDFLTDILEAVDRILAYIVRVSEKEFLKQSITQDAVIRNIVVIGEATKNISEPFRQAHSELPWKDLAGVRDKLIHHNFGVNLEIVWQIVQNDLPRLKPQIEELLTDPNQ